MNYFDKVPTINYRGRVAKNLITKARFSDETRNNKFLYYPYTINDSMRSDMLSNRYYDNPGYSWLIWMTNNIIDPYYQMPMSEEEFNNFIVNKYGSIEIAQRTIKAWRNNWYTDTERLSVSEFNNLNPAYKKYYDPTLDNYLQISGYKRKTDSTLISTNKISEIVVTGNFIEGEEVGTTTGYAFVESVSTDSIIVKNVIGTFSTDQILTGKKSFASSAITSYSVLCNSIVVSDAAYWSPVSIYEYESDLNEGRKHIKLIDNRYKNQVETELQRVFNL